MTARRPDIERRLVPRWRASVETAKAGELRSARASEAPTPHPTKSEHFEKLRSEWNDESSIELAADLVASGVALGRITDGEVLEAAQLIEGSSAPSDLREIAVRVLSETIGLPTDSKPISFDPDLARAELQIQIASQKQRVRNYPANPIAWTDLARLYVALGQQQKAHHAIRLATALAPNNRFVLRSAARFFVHSDGRHRSEHLDEGLSLLRKTRLVRSDPWLMAAEISLSTIAQQTPRTVKLARTLSDSDELHPWDLSELNGALGTLAIEQGGLGKPIRFFRKSLRQPTENALAQAQWARDLHHVHAVTDSSFTAFAAPPAEALALKHRSGREWDDVIVHCRAWSVMEPTSARPLILGSFVAEVALANGEIARDFAKRALMIAPNDPWIHNNLAVALVYIGELREAEKHANRFQIHELSSESHAAYWATLGLIAYRRGQREAGLDSYLKAAQTEAATRDVGLRAMVMWHLLQEEARLRVPGTENVAKQLWRYTRSLPIPELEAIHDRVMNPDRRLMDRAAEVVRSVFPEPKPVTEQKRIEKHVRQLFVDN